MLPLEIAAQAVSIVAMAFNIFSYQNKRQRGVILFQLFGSGLFAVSFFILGAFVGGLLNLIGVVRAIVFMNKEKLRTHHPLWLIGFVTVYLLSYLLTFTVFGKEPTAAHLIVEFLPVVGMTATTISFQREKAATVRRYGLISSPSWLVYNVVSGSLGAILCEVFSLISILIGIWRLDIQKRKPE